MKNSRLQQSLKRASKKLGIDIEIPFVLDLPCGRIEAEALVKDFGYERGVVINMNTGELGNLYKHLAEFGYGTAPLPEPTYDDEHDSEKWIMRCRKWGWKRKRNPPDWY